MMITQANLQKKRIHTHYGKIVKTLVFKNKNLNTNVFYYKDVRRLDQLRADKFVQNVGKVRKVKTFPDELAYTPKWLVAEHRLKGREAAWEDSKKFVCLPTVWKIG